MQISDKKREVHLFAGKLIGRPLKLRSKDKMFICSTYNNHGKRYCSVHSIREDLLEELISEDLHALAENVIIDEESARNQFLTERSKQTERDRKDKEKAYKSSESRLNELDRLIQSAYEDKVLKAIPEDVCMSLIQSYLLEKESLTERVTKLQEELAQADEDEAMVDEYVRRLKKYANCETLTGEMVLQLIDHIEVGEAKTDGTLRNIRIYYKFQNTCSYLSLTSQPKSDKQQIQ